MPKFYAKIDEAVEGPFEPRLLKYVPGFSEETLVSPEDLTSEEWTQAFHVPEIRPHLHLTPELIPPSAFAPRSMEPAIQPPSGLQAPAESTQRMQPPSAIPSPKVPPDVEMLDVMERFSGQIPSAPAAPAAPAAKSAVPPAIPDFIPPDFTQAAETSAPGTAPAEKFVPKRAKKSKWVLWVFLAFVIVAAAAGYMAFQMGMLDAWLNPPASRIEVAPPLPEPAPQVEQKPPEPPKIEKNKPVSPAKKTEKSAPKKEKPKAKAPPPPAPRPKPAKLDPLKNQKYMMPGVPSPKVQEKSKETPPPADPAAASEAAAPNEAPAEKAPAQTDDEYERALREAKEKEKAEKKKEKKEKKKSANDEDYFDFQWIGADPGEKR